DYYCAVWHISAYVLF
nr:immunoglobulin light chain junction region [Macaca mulatta]